MLLVMLVSLGLIATFQQAQVARSARELRIEALEAEARLIAGRVVRTADGSIRIAAVPAGRYGQRWVVRDDSGNVLVAFGEQPDTLPVPIREPDTEQMSPITPGLRIPLRDLSTFAVSQTDGSRLVGVTLHFDLGGASYAVQVVETEDLRDSLLDNLVRGFFGTVGWLLVPGMALVFLVSLLTVWVELTPMRELSRIASTIGPDTAGRRLPEGELPREILPLVQAMNAVLERLDISMRALREFTADAAHELRTPLAVLRAQCETLPADQAARLIELIDAMTRQVNQLLRLAEVDQLIVNPAARADLGALAGEVAAQLALLAVTEGKSLALSRPDHPIVAVGDPETLKLALRNLVENAIGHTARGTTVEIEVLPPALLRVRDHGPGFRDGDEGKLFQRFWRGDRNDQRGMGLGLAIVAKIAALHHATVVAENVSDGGAVFTLRLMSADGTTSAAARPLAGIPLPAESQIDCGRG